MKDWIEADDTNWEQVMDEVTTKREKELNKQLVSLKNIRNKEPQRQGKFLNKKLAIESLDEDTFEDDWYDNDWTPEDEDDIENYEEDDPITPEQEAFANELREFLQSLIDNEEAMMEEDNGSELEEKFTSQQSLMKHFQKHCLGNNANKKSRISSVYYDFTSVKQYSTYEKKLDSLFDIGNENLILVQGPFDIEEVNNAFKKLFEGNKYVTLGWSWGFTSGNKAVQLSLHSFSSDATTNYKTGNTIDIFIRTPSPRIITLYPIDASKLKNKLAHIIKKYSAIPLTISQDDKKLLDSLQKDSIMKEDIESKSNNSNYLNTSQIKSNGIYSLNYGWLKHPVQQNIPDIDMEEFEKEFKKWEDRYFDLLNKLNK